MQVTATRPSKRGASSSNTKTTATRSNSSGTGKPAARSNASTTPGKSGPATRLPNRRVGARASRRELPPSALREARNLQSLGIQITNIHKIIQKKHKEFSYYDIWKALRQAQ